MKILVVTNVQKGFMKENSIEKENVANDIADYIETKRALGYKILYVMDCHDADKYGSTKEGTFMEPHCLWGTVECEPLAAIKDTITEDDRVLYDDTFTNKTLVGYLKEIDYTISAIEFCGFHLDNSILANAVAVAAAFPNVRIGVISDLVVPTKPIKTNAAKQILDSLLIGYYSSDISNYFEFDKD